MTHCLARVCSSDAPHPAQRKSVMQSNAHSSPLCPASRLASPTLCSQNLSSDLCPSLYSSFTLDVFQSRSYRQLKHSKPQEITTTMSMQPAPKEMSKTDALALPEVLSLVGQFLSPPTLAQCLLVCHLWHVVLKPQFWREVKVKSEGMRPVPSLLVVQENSFFIRKFAIDYKFLLIPQDYLACPHLDDLTVSGPSFANHSLDGVFIGPLRTLIQKHSVTLRSVAFEVRVGEAVLEDLLDCPRLEILSFAKKIGIKRLSRWVPMYQKLRMQLHTLVFSGLEFYKGRIEISTPAMIEEWHRSYAGPSRIQDLTL